jgi:hypothetical protein
VIIISPAIGSSATVDSRPDQVKTVKERIQHNGDAGLNPEDHQQRHGAAGQAALPEQANIQ